MFLLQPQLRSQPLKKGHETRARMLLLPGHVRETGNPRMWAHFLQILRTQLLHEKLACMWNLQIGRNI